MLFMSEVLHNYMIANIVNILNIDFSLNYDDNSYD